MPVRVRIGGRRGGRGKNKYHIPRMVITLPTNNELANAAAAAELVKNRANISAGRDAGGTRLPLEQSTIERRGRKRDGVPGPRPAVPFNDTGRLLNGLRATGAMMGKAKVVASKERAKAVAIMTNRDRQAIGVHGEVLDAVLERFLAAMVK